MNIGIVADPLAHPDWPKMKALLEPAARLGGLPVMEPHHAVWAVYDDGLLAAATTRLTFNGTGDIVLCGGVGSREWARPLADRICDWFRDEGMERAVIIGRRGWHRLLPDWTVLGSRGRHTVFERRL